MGLYDIFKSALQSMLAYRTRLITALIWPLMALGIINATGSVITGGVIGALLVFAELAIHAIFAITVHRVVMLGPDSVSKWGQLDLTTRETRFMLHFLGVGCMGLAAMFLAVVPVIGVAMALVAFCWLTARVILVFPGIAVDEGITFRTSWALTEPHQMSLFLLIFSFHILLGIPTFLLSHIPFTGLLSSLISILIIVIEVAALSVVYRHIKSAQ